MFFPSYIFEHIPQLYCFQSGEKKMVENALRWQNEEFALRKPIVRCDPKQNQFHKLTSPSALALRSSLSSAFENICIMIAFPIE